MSDRLKTCLYQPRKSSSQKIPNNVPGWGGVGWGGVGWGGIVRGEGHYTRSLALLPISPALTLDRRGSIGGVTPPVRVLSSQPLEM
jgi:hypothetical protein